MTDRIFDCFFYDGGERTLETRLNELSGVVDHFIIVEGTRTSAGKPKPLYFRQQFQRFKTLAPKIRYVVVADTPKSATPRGFERWRNNSIVRGLADAEGDDLLLISEVDQIPRAAVLSDIKRDPEHDVFTLRLTGAADAPEAVAVKRRRLDGMTPDAFLSRLRDGAMQAKIYESAGLNVPPAAAARSDAAARDPAYADRQAAQSEQPSGAPESARPRFLNLRPQRDRGREPVIICPHVHDSEEAEIRRTFALDDARGSALPFFLWKDAERLGPELAFEHCWSRFPDRDIIIIHSDMSPLPGDSTNKWYRDILRFRDRLPDAGMIACDLLYPLKDDAGNWYIQCAGGYFQHGELGFIGGHVDISERSVGPDAMSYGEDFRRVREVEWVTFGGVYIRREVIDTCGAFDRRYRWAYVRDVDYCLEARVRGFRLYQVPVNLLHHESRTTRPLMAETPRLNEAMAENFDIFRDKWHWYTHDQRRFPWAAARFRPWDGKRVDIGSPLSERFLDFESGWHEREPWGRWSDGRESVLRLKWPDAKPDSAELRVWARYFWEKEDTEVLIDGRPVGSVRFRSRRHTKIAIALDDRQRRDGYVTITFRHRNPVSPQQLGLSDDPRMLKLGLRAVALV